MKPLAPGTEAGWYPDPDSLLKDRFWSGTGWTDRTRSGLAPSPEALTESLAESGGAAIERPWRFVSITTSPDLPATRLTEHLGEVVGVTVRARNMLSDFGAGVRNMVGGEVKTYTDMLAVAHREALDRLRESAWELGADAVVSMRMTTNSMIDGILEVVAYGAAVRTSAAPDPGGSPHG
jgi:uncharacterized protein YbjQ (UPF0145 family)